MVHICMGASLQRQYDTAVEFLQTEMGMKVSERTRSEAISTELSSQERDMYTKRFQTIDQEKKGYVSINDIRRSLKVHKTGNDFIEISLLCCVTKYMTQS